jgi:hypothetical protein
MLPLQPDIAPFFSAFWRHPAGWMLCLCLFGGSGFSQSPGKATALSAAVAPGTGTAKDSLIFKLFEQPASIQWIKSMKGRIDDVSLVDVTLGFDGHNCRGYLTYIKSHNRFRLLGTLQNNQITLEEHDPSNALTGTLEGTFTGRKLDASWTNADNTIGSRLEAEEPMPGQTISTGCGENKWVNRYITRYNGARADMVIIRMHNGAMEGFLWVEADSKTYQLKGELKPDASYEMEALLPNGKIAGILQGSLKNQQNTDCTWVGSGEKRTFNFAIKDKLQLGCYDYADYRSSYDAIYPRPACVACNTWLDQQVNAWVNQCKNTMAGLKEPLTPASRNTYRASCWADIACWTENVFTGYLTFTDTKSEQSQGKSFNFDLRAGKEISMNDLFNKNFNAKAYFEAYAKKEAPKLPQFAADVKYREWITKEGFPLFALRRDGLELSTLFHSVYGRQLLLIPYSDLKPYMKKDNPVADLVK